MRDRVGEKEGRARERERENEREREREREEREETARQSDREKERKRERDIETEHVDPGRRSAAPTSSPLARRHLHILPRLAALTFQHWTILRQSGGGGWQGQNAAAGTVCGRGLAERTAAPCSATMTWSSAFAGSPAAIAAAAHRAPTPIPVSAHAGGAFIVAGGFVLLANMADSDRNRPARRSS